ncbi:MAG TPA: hypothetical protein VFT86_00800 [Gaiellaceae bacterium]|nr:hypothetical protein [Gaiellaceae bacterium]
MGFFKRERPIHEQLAAEAGLDIDGLDDELAAGAGESIQTRVPMPSDLLAVHGIPREREWDAVASAQAPDLPGEGLEYVALADGTFVVDEDVPEGSLSPLADALESQISPPYHGYAFWQQDDVWAVAAKRVQVVEVPEDVPGDEVELTVNDGVRSTVVDGEESGAELSSLETFASQQFGSFVLRASRLDDLLWEVTIIPL